MSRIAVVLFNLGGPDTSESVQPFLFNLFHDPAIISLPQPFRWFLAHLISRRRAPIAQDIYKKIAKDVKTEFLRLMCIEKPLITIKRAKTYEVKSNQSGSKLHTTLNSGEIKVKR